MSEDAHPLNVEPAPAEKPADFVPPGATQNPPTMIPIESVPADQPILLLGDLVGAVNIIDTVAKRGAFRGDELQEIGGIRDRLAAFVKFNSPKASTAPAPAPAPAAVAS